VRIAFLFLDGQIAGGQTVARQLMLGAREAGHDVCALSPQPGPMLDLLALDGVPCEVVPLTRSFRLDQALRLARVLQRLRIDLLDTHTLFAGNQLSRVGALVGRVPLVAHIHAHERFHPNPVTAGAQRSVEALTARSCAAVIAVSHSVHDRLLENGYPRGRVLVIANGVALPTASPPPGGNSVRAVCIARLAPSKGQETLLRALALAEPGIEVDFVGDDLEQGGRYRRTLEQLAIELDVDARAHFLGFRGDVGDLIDRSDLLVLPSQLEGLPIVVLEAMARERAVVATAVGGTRELVRNGETGLLVDWNDAAGLAAALSRLRDDAELRRRLGVAGRRRVEEEFTLERMIGRTLAVYAAVA
jgi:glycosyltransferase involved in cell wall biosynthesis